VNNEYLAVRGGLLPPVSWRRRADEETRKKEPGNPAKM